MVANQLFLGPSGGIWLHDAKYRIKVFDGVGVLPENGSVFDVATAHLTYQNHAFWTFVGNEVYRLLPGRERQPEFNLTPGSEITQIGASQGYLWLTDQSQFYAYHIETQVLDVYPLSRIYQYNQALNVVINDAQHIDGEWVLATNAGVYISRSNGFRYVSASNKRPVSQLFFSKTRRELLVGSDDGALMIDVDSGSDEPVERIGHGQVTAMIESDGAYWIGSDKGLYLYSVFTGQTDYLKGDTHQGHQLRGEHIYALLNDRQGGIWVSTEFGVQYHSLFGDQFKRYAQPVFDEAQHQLTPEMISLAQTKGHYWFLSDSGLHQLKHSGQQAKTFYSGKVFDYAEDEQWLWLATSQGVKVVDADSGVLNTQRNLPSLLRDKPTLLIEITSTGDVLGVTQSVLWRYQLETGALKQWHLSQLNPQSLQAGRWQLFAAQDGTVVLSGDSAISVIRGETVHTIKGSQKIGRISQWVNMSEHQLWAVGHYGIYQLDTQQLSLSDVMMPAEGVMPQCVVRNQDGLWLSSSFGLSRYDMSGQLLAHYSAPFGVIHNEFLPSACVNAVDDQRDILFATQTGVMRVSTYPLVTQSVPQPKLIISQMTINQNQDYFGGLIDSPIRLQLGDSVSLRVGGLPQLNSANLEYRLTDQQAWQPLNSNLLTLSHLTPANYQLSVRYLLPNGVVSDEVSVSLFVVEPWYFKRVVIIGAVTLGLALLAVGFYWRSRVAAANHRRMQAEVARKTQHLMHKDRELLAQNQQLKKQLQVRKVLLSELLARMKLRLSKQVWRTTSSDDIEHIIKRMTLELELLENTRSDVQGEKAAFDLVAIVKTALSVWHEEIQRHAIAITLEHSENEPVWIMLKAFTLDQVLSGLINNLLRRCYQKQSVTVKIEQDIEAQCVRLSFYDQGRGIDELDSTPTDWEVLRDQVMVSGGSLKIYSSDERNIIELSWGLATIFDEIDVADDVNSNFDVATEQDSPWLEQVQYLIAQHYSDPEFTTVMAAKLLYVSERSLQRRFKQLSGRTFKDVLNETRLNHACQLLLDGERVSEVAFACGYNDPSYFSQRFKALFGVSPSQLVENQEVL